MSTKGNYIGEESERIRAYYQDRQANIRITMLQSRLSELHKKGIIESPEIDKILEDIYAEDSKLRFGWGLNK